MYPALILELYKHPSNYGTIPDATSSVDMSNPSCGDEISVDFKYTGNKLTDVAFRGQSCAISRAAASLLTDAIKGKKKTDLKKLDAEYMKKLIGVDVAPARLPCLLLSLEALKKSFI